jgi:hemerythrin superfamily protein
MLKRDNWTNDEVINILESRKISIKMDDAKNWDDASYKHATRHNEAIDQCIYQFWDFKADPEESDSAMAYETDNEQIYVISAPLPQ